MQISTDHENIQTEQEIHFSYSIGHCFTRSVLSSPKEICEICKRNQKLDPTQQETNKEKYDFLHMDRKNARAEK